MKRKTFLSGLVLTMLFASTSLAQDAGWKPTKPVDVIVHSAAGAGNDLLAREIVNIIEKNGLSDTRYRVVNMPGGGTTQATTYLAGQSGDDHKIAIGSNAWLTENLLQQEAQFGWVDFTSIAVLGEDPWLLLAKTDFEHDDFNSFVDSAINNPNKMAQAGGSVGARDQLISLKIMLETGAKWNYVPYPSRGERAAALLGGHVQLYSTDVLEGGELIRSGRAKAIAALAANRLTEYPELPTVEEVFPKATHLPLVRFVVAPKDVSPEVVSYYEGLMRRVTETDDWKELRNKFGLGGTFMGAQEASLFATTHRDRIRQYSVDAGIPVVR